MTTQNTQRRHQQPSMYYSRAMGLLLVSYFLFLCFGHLIFPNSNETIRFFMIIYLVGRTLTFLLGGLVTYSETNKVCEKAANMNERSFNQDFRNHPQLTQIFHVFVLSNCESDLSIVRQTLDRLKLHRGANNYVVLLTDSNNQQKQASELKELVQSYTNQFLILGLIDEPIAAKARPFWFMEWLQEKCKGSYNIGVDNVLLTILDAHSWVPEIYIRQIEDHLTQRQGEPLKWKCIYQPIQIYTRNHLDTPFTTRISNQLEVCLQANDCLSRYRPSLPKNNYSLRYSLAKRISSLAGQIYSNQDSIQLQRILPQIKVKLIYAPFNRLNICIDGGHFSNTKTTFVRIVDEAAKQLNLLYDLVFSFGTASKWRDSLSILYIFVHISDKLLVVLVLQTIHSQTFTLLLSKAFAPLNIENVSILLCIALMILTSVHFLCYQFAKRKASFVLYGLTNKTIFDIFQFNLLVGYLVVFFMVPAFVVSTFKSVFVDYSEQVAVEDAKTDKPK